VEELLQIFIMSPTNFDKRARANQFVRLSDHQVHGHYSFDSFKIRPEFLGTDSND